MASILQLVEGLVSDAGAKAAYTADPGGYLDRQGFGDLDADDLREALAQAADSFPPSLAARVDPDAGLAPLAGVDLAELGLEGVDDFSADVMDEIGPDGFADVEDGLVALDGFATDAGGELDAGGEPGLAVVESSADPGFDVDLDRAEPMPARSDEGLGEHGRPTVAEPVLQAAAPASGVGADPGVPSSGFAPLDSPWDGVDDDPAVGAGLVGIESEPLSTLGADDEEPWYVHQRAEDDPAFLDYDDADHGDLSDQ